MGYNFLFALIGVGIVGSGWLLRRAKSAAIARQAQSGFDNYRAKLYMGPFQKEMTTREAYLILGLKEKSPKEKVMSAHKKLMLLNHPDNGGSTYLATKVNQAKELLLEKIE